LACEPNDARAKGFLIDSGVRENYKQRLSEKILTPPELNREKFEKMFVELMARPAPSAHSSSK